MTSQQIADQALELWRKNKRYPEIEALLDEYFGLIPTQEEADRIQSRVSEIFSCPTTSIELSASSAPIAIGVIIGIGLS